MAKIRDVQTTKTLLVTNATSLVDRQPIAPETLTTSNIFPKGLDNEAEQTISLTTPILKVGQEIIQKQVQKLEKARKQILQEHNPAGVHDMRVATRRISTALKILQYTELENNTLLHQYRKGLRQVMHKLSNARDLDVFIEHVENYKNALSSEQSEGLVPLEQYLKHKRTHAQASMDKTLQKHKTQHLLNQLEAFAKKPSEGVNIFTKDPNEVRPMLIRHFVGSQVWQKYEAVLAYETAMTEPNKVEVATLHQLRIAFKHFRYTLEFFADALPGAASSLIEALTEMQNYLGELHDHDVAVVESDFLLARQPDDTVLRAYRDARAHQRDQLQLNFPTKWASINSINFRQRLSDLLN